MTPTAQSARHVRRVYALALLSALCLACERPEDLCAPVTDRIGFFSQGDCVFTRARFFRGHEWLTFFGNAELEDGDRFADAEVQWMALGNRRVDFPKELLAHLDNGILAYVDALMDRTERPDEQAHHFLLADSGTEESAAEAAREHVFAVTAQALRLWNRDRIRALTLLGQAQHTLQDSFSPAHTVRRTENSSYGALPSDARSGSEGEGVQTCRGACGCILRVKAYLRRDEEFRAGVLYHGTEADTIGHITTEDSIYKRGRSCHRPLTQGAVFDCLNAHARQGALATMSYLAWVRRELRAGNAGEDTPPERLREGFDSFARDHLASCSE